MKPLALAMSACILAGCGAHPPGTGEGTNHVGNDRCATCHEQEARYCRYGAHRTLDCERCHGPGEGHAAAEDVSRSTMSLGSVELCMSCHVETISSFEDHLGRMERDHRIKLDRQKSGTDCVYCHDPHLLE